MGEGIVRIGRLGALMLAMSFACQPGDVVEARQAQATPVPATITVLGTQQWTDTGIDVPAGAVVQVSASGTIQTSAGNLSQSPAGNPTCTPTAGFASLAGPCYALVGQIRSGSEVPQPPQFASYLHAGTCANRTEPSLATLVNLVAPVPLVQIGDGTTFRATTGGRLFLGVNDDFFEDNAGDWLATVEIGESSDPLPAPDIAASVTNLAVPIDEIARTPHTLAIWDASGNFVACGDIVGTRRPEDRGLAIGLRPVGDSGYGGIGYLAPNPANPAQTSVSLFLAPDLVATPGGE